MKPAPLSVPEHNMLVLISQGEFSTEGRKFTAVQKAAIKELHRRRLIEFTQHRFYLVLSETGIAELTRETA